MNQLAIVAAAAQSYGIPFLLGGGHAVTVLMSFMKKSEGLVRPPENMELDFPDWSGMDDSSAGITPEAAFRLCELYPQLLASACKGKAELRPKESLPEFVL